MYDIFVQNTETKDTMLFATVETLSDHADKAKEFLAGRGLKVIIHPAGKFQLVRNMMSGINILQAKDTPHCCRVDSEAYWSM